MPLKIMVVDDEPAILELMKGFVEPLGCDVLMVQDSRVAAQAIERQKFDGIFLDALMPDLDGFELTRRIRSSPSNRNVPVVMLTGRDDVQTMRQGFQAGITVFLGKPITQDRVVRVVNALRVPLLKERRQYARLVFRAKVDCRWEGNGKGHADLQCLDISERGMALMQAENIKLGQIVEITFNFPGSARAVRVRARVVRTMPPDGIGVMFVDMTDENRLPIQQYIAGAVKG